MQLQIELFHSNPETEDFTYIGLQIIGLKIKRKAYFWTLILVNELRFQLFSSLLAQHKLSMVQLCIVDPKCIEIAISFRV